MRRDDGDDVRGAGQRHPAEAWEAHATHSLAVHATHSLDGCGIGVSPMGGMALRAMRAQAWRAGQGPCAHGLEGDEARVNGTRRRHGKSARVLPGAIAPKDILGCRQQDQRARPAAARHTSPRRLTVPLILHQGLAAATFTWCRRPGGCSLREANVNRNCMTIKHLRVDRGPSNWYLVLGSRDLPCRRSDTREPVTPSGGSP